MLSKENTLNLVAGQSARAIPRTLPRPLTRINWTHSFLVVSLHVCGLLCFWFWPRRIDLFLFVGLYLSTTFAIGIGYHRLFTHRGFKCHTWMRRMLAWMGAAALQGGPARWSAIHRRHHQMTDKEGDPHTPLMGFLHAHVGWILRRDAEEGSDYRELVPDVCGDDPWIRVLDKGVLFTMPWVLTGVVCYAVAGWRGVLWGTVLRTLALWHFTWCINSVCHVWGTRPNATRDESRNVWWLGLLTLGEGWHNNHHARPSAAVHGWRWYEVDFSGYAIRLMARLGLVWKVIREPRS
ncbi:MAG TPA: acyl-CoA desaturase [Pyrinomonadaceae bacterium]